MNTFHAGFYLVITAIETNLDFPTATDYANGSRPKTPKPSLMKPSSTGKLSPRGNKARDAGFALVVTLSLMILLTIVAVGLLTLSSISLRSSAQSSDMNIARSNARMAMMLAIGELQKTAGLDTRVTARADLLEEKNPPITGVWKSWEGTNHEQTGNAAGRPISPGNYKSAKQDRFLNWLVSGNPANQTLPDTAQGTNKVTLLGKNSVGDEAKLQVHLAPSLISTENGRGAFAWWASGENQKVRLPNPYKPNPASAGRWAMNMKSHSVADPEILDMDEVFNDESLATRAVSLKESDLFGSSSGEPKSRKFFHDMSTTSVGLLTNTATGGWKKDLSVLTENWSKVGTRNLPFFRVKPGQDIMGNLPTTGDATAPKSMIYPWSAYRGSSANPPIYRHGAVSIWENLKDWALAYRAKGISIAANGRASMASSSTAIDGDAYSFLHKVRVLPVIARIQWVMSHTSGPAVAVTGQTAPPAGSLEPRLLMTPVVTMWNPYNVEINFSNLPLKFRIPRPLPVALQYTVNGVKNPTYNRLTSGSLTTTPNHMPPLSTATEFNYQILSSIILKPGETRLFSPASTVPVAANQLLELKPGYRSRGGHFLPIKDSAGRAYAPGTSTISANARFDTEYLDGNSGVGIYLDMLTNEASIGERRHLAYRMVYTPAVASEVYKPITGLSASPPLNSIQSNPSPFLTTVFGARMASKTHIAAKGFVQSSPLVNYTAMGGKDLVEVTISRHYGGSNHPVNSPFDYSFEKVAPNDSLLPNESDTTGRGYIVTGFTKADGLSRCVISELPTRPVQSLGELQNWDIRYENPVPPFSFNIIGNSDATPLLPSNAVVNSADASLNVNLQHDDSYCANHVLYDDWFFSSIAPDPTNFGNGGKTIQKTYTDFVSGAAPLPNRAYQPIAEDRAAAAGNTANANALYNNQVNKADSWKTIASRLEVEGMFNVNSTSFTAWRALLGHARKQKVPYIKESGASWSADVSSETDNAFSRFSVAGDVEAKSMGSSGGFLEATEFAGYRILDDKILDSLAEQIVNQVRLRGPFLSLAEFVNRQLSNGDLALAGAVQAALNELAKSPSTNPYAVMEGFIPRPSLAVPPSAGNAEYRFPDAAVGHATYGLPGWTRQADVLRALAPVLTARDDTFTLRCYGDARDRTGRNHRHRRL